MMIMERVKDLAIMAIKMRLNGRIGTPMKHRMRRPAKTKQFRWVASNHMLIRKCLARVVKGWRCKGLTRKVRMKSSSFQIG